MKKTISIYDVAKKAKVSIATVSRVLNGVPMVKEETRENITKIADQLGYELSTRRPGPKPGRPTKKKKVALINFLDLQHFGADTSSTFLNLKKGVIMGGHENGFLTQLHVFCTEEELPASIAEGKYAGFLLHGYKPHATFEKFLRKKPCCWLMNNPWAPTWGDHLMPDHREVGMMALDYLVEHGAKNPVAIKLGPTDCVQALRAEGFAYAASLQRIAAQFLTSKKEYPTIQQTYPEVVYIDEIVEGIKKMRPRPDGFFINCDHALSLLYPILVQEKCVIPGKTTLIGCNNQVEFLKGIKPYPATMDVHFDVVGMMGAAQLVWRMKHGEILQRARSYISPNLIFLS